MRYALKLVREVEEAVADLREEEDPQHIARCIDDALESLDELEEELRRGPVGRYLASLTREA